MIRIQIRRISPQQNQRTISAFCWIMLMKIIQICEIKNQPKGRRKKNTLRKREEREREKNDNDHRRKSDTFFFSLRMSLLELKNCLLLRIVIFLLFFFFSASSSSFANGLHWLFVCMFKHEREGEATTYEFLPVWQKTTVNDFQAIVSS